MATTTISNVINLQPGGPRVTAMANRILLECRDLAARRLREALREMLQKTSENLLLRSDVAIDNDGRRVLLALNDGLREKGGRLEGLLAAHWGREFDTALKGRPASGTDELLLEEMQIVDYGEMDEELALKSLARRLNNKCEGEIYALGRRFNHLAGKDKDGEAENPSAPEVLTRALQNALREADFDTASRLELCRTFEALIEEHFGPIYHALNAHLVQQRILPDLRRDYSRTSSQAQNKESLKEKTNGDIFTMLQQLVAGTKNLAGAPVPANVLPTMLAAGSPIGIQAASSPPGGLEAMLGSGGISVPPAHVWASLEALQHAPIAAPVVQPSAPSEHTNVLYHFRASEAGQNLGQLDAITVDIVAMLFDMIFDDREISDPIKALVGKLQIPVLKVAMLDRSFFSSKAHPARHLLDLISRAALRWGGREVGRDDPVYRKIAEVIDDIHDNFKQDTALFQSLCEQLERFLTEYEESDSGNVTRAALLVVQRELDELADMAVDSEIQSLLSRQVPRSVADLLDHEWRSLLKRTHLEEGPDSKAWESALRTACELVDSVRPKNDVHERQALARQLPILVKQLSTGFDRLGIDGERRRTLLDALFPLHAAALRGTEPPPSAVTEPAPPPLISEPAVTSQALGDGEVTVESISVTSPLSAPAASQDVEELQRGDWIEYLQADGSTIRYRLSWISPQRGIFLFTNPQSPNALAVSPEAMSLQLQRGEVRIVPTEPIFDRALTRTIDILQAA